MAYDDTRARGGATIADRRPTRRHHYAVHDPDGPAKLSTTVIHELAEVMGRDVTEAGWALADQVDPAALDLLFPSGEAANPGAARHVAFAVDGYRITVYGDGQIVITPPGAPTA